MDTNWAIVRDYIKAHNSQTIVHVDCIHMHAQAGRQHTPYCSTLWCFHSFSLTFKFSWNDCSNASMLHSTSAGFQQSNLFSSEFHFHAAELRQYMHTVCIIKFYIFKCCARLHVFMCLSKDKKSFPSHAGLNSYHCSKKIGSKYRSVSSQMRDRQDVQGFWGTRLYIQERSS